jgi:hypothetical protein
VRYDAEPLVRAWINTQADLVGKGMPIENGAYLTQIRAPATGAYLLLTLIGGGDALTPEKPAHRARISAGIYGITKAAAGIAAAAYATKLQAALRGIPVSMSPALCLFAADITGPSYQPDGDEPRYICDSDFYLM